MNQATLSLQISHLLASFMCTLRVPDGLLVKCSFTMNDRRSPFPLAIRLVSQMSLTIADFARLHLLLKE